VVVASGQLALLLDDALILIMRTDPNPDEIRSIFDR